VRKNISNNWEKSIFTEKKILLFEVFNVKNLFPYTLERHYDMKDQERMIMHSIDTEYILHLPLKLISFYIPQSQNDDKKQVIKTKLDKNTNVPFKQNC